MDEPSARIITRISGMNPWRAGCGESRTSGSEGGPEKPTSRKTGRALRPDPYTKLLGPATWTYYYLYVILDVFSRRVEAGLPADHGLPPSSADPGGSGRATQDLRPAAQLWPRTRQTKHRRLLRRCCVPVAHRH
jgi:hypothetical protein